MRAAVINAELSKLLADRGPRITASKIAEILGTFTPTPTPTAYQSRGRRCKFWSLRLSARLPACRELAANDLPS
jgi:hypothetical protein